MPSSSVCAQSTRRRLPDSASKIIFSPEALAELDDIYGYHADVASEAVAGRVTAGLTDRIEILRTNPRLGPVGRLPSGLRVLVQGAYRIYYEPREDHVRIVRILHQSRDENTAFDR